MARALPDAPDDENSILWPLTRFVSTSPDELASLAEELEEAGVNVSEFKEEWFAPADAVTALDAILQEVSADPTLLSFPPKARIRDVSDVVEELEELRAQLKIAAAQGARFHLQFCF